MKKKTVQRIKDLMMIGGVLAVGQIIFCQDAFAAKKTTGVEEIDTGLKALKTLFLGIVSMVGVILTIKNIMDFASAWNNRDQTSMGEALRGIISGLIMAFVGGILALFGL